MIHSAQYIFSVHDVNTNDVTYDYVKMADERDDAIEVLIKFLEAIP